MIKNIILIILINCVSSAVIPIGTSGARCNGLYLKKETSASEALFNGISRSCCNLFKGMMEEQIKGQTMPLIPPDDDCQLDVYTNGFTCLKNDADNCKETCEEALNLCMNKMVPYVRNLLEVLKLNPGPIGILQSDLQTPRTVQVNQRAIPNSGWTKHVRPNPPRLSPRLHRPEVVHKNETIPVVEMVKNADSDYDYNSGNEGIQKIQDDYELDRNQKEEEEIIEDDSLNDIETHLRLCFPTQPVKGNKYVYNINGSTRVRGPIIKDIGPWTFTIKYDDICLYMVKSGQCIAPSAISKSHLHDTGVLNRDPSIMKVIEFCGWDLIHEQYTHPGHLKCECEAGTIPKEIELFGAIPHCERKLFRTVKANLDKREMIAQVNTVRAKYCQSKNCHVTIRGRPNEVEVEIKSKRGYYTITVGKETKSGFFEGTHEVSFELGKAGSSILVGHCNNDVFKRRFIFTTKEYCDAMYPSFFQIIQNSMCKHYRAIVEVVIAISITLLCYFLHEVCAMVVAGPLTVLVFCTTYFCMKRFYCQRCLNLKFKGAHICKISECPYCYKKVIKYDYNETERKRIMDIHLNNCKKAKKSKTTWFAVMRVIYWYIYESTDYIFARLPRFIIAGFLIAVIIITIPGVDADFSDDVAKKMIEIYGYNLSLMIKEEFSEGKTVIMANASMSLGKGKICKQDFFLNFNLMSILIIAAIFLMRMAREKIIRAYYVVKRKIDSGSLICDKCYDLSDYENHKRSNCGILVCPHCNCSVGLPGLEKMKTSLASFRYLHINSHGDFTKYSVWARIQTCIFTSRLLSLLKYIILITLIINLFGIASCEEVKHENEMIKVEEDIDEFIKDLLRGGFHPYHARFTGGARDKLSAISEKKECTNGKCIVSLEMEADMTIKQGKELGYLVRSKHLPSSMKLNVKINLPKSICKYRNLYRTGEIKHLGVSDDTCTDDCKKCHENLKELYNHKPEKTTIHKKDHPDSSSWACDGLGCASMGSGCTCLECWCEMTEPDWTVKKLINEKHEFDLCIVMANNGYCKSINKDIRDKLITVLEYSKGIQNCPEIIACDKHSSCFKGHINDIGENLERFGSAKLIGNFTKTSPDINVNEVCHFGKHRYFSMERCCHDTYYLKDELEPTGMYRLDNMRGFGLDLKDLGSWKLRIKLPNLIYQEKTDKVDLKSMKITQCRGCYSCNEGGSCLMQFISNLDHTGEFSCEGCATDQNAVLFKKGQNSIPFNIFCYKKTGNLTCSLDSHSMSGMYTLKDEPKVPHGNGLVNVDITKNIHHECDGWFCGFKMEFMDIYKRSFWTVVGLAIIALIFSLIYFVYKLLS